MRGPATLLEPFFVGYLEFDWPQVLPTAVFSRVIGYASLFMLMMGAEIAYFLVLSRG